MRGSSSITDCSVVPVCGLQNNFLHTLLSPWVVILPFFVGCRLAFFCGGDSQQNYGSGDEAHRVIKMLRMCRLDNSYTHVHKFIWVYVRGLHSLQSNQMFQKIEDDLQCLRADNSLRQNLPTRPMLYLVATS